MNNIVKATKKVFSSPAYWLIAGLVGVIVLSIFVLMPNFPLLFKVWGNINVTPIAKINLFFQLLGSITTNFHLLSAITATLTSLLLGINLAMMVFSFIKRI
jgi:hypothetical protein